MSDEIIANLDAERALLGSMLLDAQVADSVIAKIAEDSFFSEPHRLVIKAIQAVRAQGGAVDMVTVMEALRQAGTLERVGGATYISTLANSVPTADNAEHYLRIVQEKAALRTIASGDVPTRVGVNQFRCPSGTPCHSDVPTRVGVNRRHHHDEGSTSGCPHACGGEP